MGFYCTIVAPILLGLHYETKLSCANEVTIPATIIEKLESNAMSLDPISFVWVVQKKSPHDVQKLADKLGTPQDFGLLEQRVCTFMWQNKKGYFADSCKNTVSSSDGKENKLPLISDKTLEKILNIQERSFNGIEFCAGFKIETKDAVPGLSVYPLTYYMEHPLKNTFYQRYTTNLGYKFPSIGRELGNSQQSYILFLIENGNLIETSNVDIKNNQFFHIVVKGYDYWEQCDRFFEFWLDPEYNYAITQSEIKSLKGKKIYSIDNEQFEKISGKEVFIPRKTTVQYYTGEVNSDNISLIPLFTEEFLLTEISTKKIDDKQFDLRTKYIASGTHIGDRTLKDSDTGVQYIVPANPADLDRVIEAALNGTDFVPTPLPSTTAIVIKWLLCIAGIAMIFYVGYEKFIKKKKKNDPNYP
jgi:hypothetical protein